MLGIQSWFTGNAIFFLPKAKSIFSLHFIILHTEHILSLTERKIIENLKRFSISISLQENRLYTQTDILVTSNFFIKSTKGSFQISLGIQFNSAYCHQCSSTSSELYAWMKMEMGVCVYTVCMPSNILPNWK